MKEGGGEESPELSIVNFRPPKGAKVLCDGIETANVVCDVLQQKEAPVEKEQEGSDWVEVGK